MAESGTVFYPGRFDRTLDEKGRLTLPSTWRCAHDETQTFLALMSDVPTVRLNTCPATLAWACQLALLRWGLRTRPGATRWLAAESGRGIPLHLTPEILPSDRNVG